MDLYLAMAAPDLVVVVHVHKSTEASIFDDLQKLFLKEITISAIFTTYFSSTFSACHSQGIIETAEYLEPDPTLKCRPLPPILRTPIYNKSVLN